MKCEHRFGSETFQQERTVECGLNLCFLNLTDCLWTVEGVTSFSILQKYCHGKFMV